MTSFFFENWGNLASVLGLVVSVLTLITARKAQEAAEDALASARLRSLAEELQESVTKAQQIGLFLGQGRWEIVWLRAQEIVSSSSAVRARWNEELGGMALDNLLIVQQLSHSIAAAALQAFGSPPTRSQLMRVSATQGRVLEILGGELGRAQGATERSVKS